MKSWPMSLQWKLLLRTALCLAATLLALFIGHTLSTALIQMSWINAPLVLVVNKIGSTPVLIVFGLLLFFVAVHVSNRGILRELQRVQDRLDAMTEGDFDTQLETSSRDEWGSIVRQINILSSQLQAYSSQIIEGLDKTASGSFTHRIPVQNGHKLGDIANSVNIMTERLHRSIEDERNAERSKNDLITGVSHDLRTPLTSILGFLQVIEQDRYQDEVEMRYYVDIAYEKAKHLQKLIDDLFEYTRVNNGMPLDLQLLDMHGFMQQLLEEYVPELEQADMSARMEVSGDTMQVWVDPELLVRAFGNLISNAIRYGQSGREVVLRLERDLEKQEVVVEVVNFGEPISERDLAHIFDRFYRVEQSRSLQTGGTGLGLAIVKSIVEANAGYITVRSNRKETVFACHFPTADAHLKNQATSQ